MRTFSRGIIALAIALSCRHVSAAQPAQAPPLTWSDVEPAAESCFALVPGEHGRFLASPESTDPLPAASDGVGRTALKFAEEKSAPAAMR